jgi:hypothetical protein
VTKHGALHSNPRHSGAGDQKDGRLRLAPGKKYKTLSEKQLKQKEVAWKAQGPEFKPQYHQKKKKRKGKVYFHSQFWRFQSTIEWPCNFLTCDEAGHSRVKLLTSRLGSQEDTEEEGTEFHNPPGGHTPVT